jgi:hypothetical protein
MRGPRVLADTGKIPCAISQDALFLLTVAARVVLQVDRERKAWLDDQQGLSIAERARLTEAVAAANRAMLDGWRFDTHRRRERRPA